MNEKRKEDRAIQIKCDMIINLFQWLSPKEVDLIKRFPPPKHTHTVWRLGFEKICWGLQSNKIETKKVSLSKIKLPLELMMEKSLLPINNDPFSPYPSGALVPLKELGLSLPTYIF